VRERATKTKLKRLVLDERSVFAYCEIVMLIFTVLQIIRWWRRRC